MSGGAAPHFNSKRDTLFAFLDVQGRDVSDEQLAPVRVTLLRQNLQEAAIRRRDGRPLIPPVGDRLPMPMLLQQLRKIALVRLKPLLDQGHIPLGKDPLKDGHMVFIAFIINI
jgi:hypothetical protein